MNGRRASACGGVVTRVSDERGSTAFVSYELETRASALLPGYADATPQSQSWRCEHDVTSQLDIGRKFNPRAQRTHIRHHARQLAACDQESGRYEPIVARRPVDLSFDGRPRRVFRFFEEWHAQIIGRPELMNPPFEVEGH